MDFDFEEILGQTQRKPINKNLPVPVDEDLHGMVDDAKSVLGVKVVNEAIRLMLRQGIPKLFEQSRKKSA